MLKRLQRKNQRSSERAAPLWFCCGPRPVGPRCVVERQKPAVLDPNSSCKVKSKNENHFLRGINKLLLTDVATGHGCFYTVRTVWHHFLSDQFDITSCRPGSAAGRWLHENFVTGWETFLWCRPTGRWSTICEEHLQLWKNQSAWIKSNQRKTK